MARQGTGFITGANAKIVIGDNTIAFCTDVSYNINVQTIPIECMGKYEVHTNEPVAYAVDGTFSILRYTENSYTVKTVKETVGSGTAATTVDVPVAEYDAKKNTGNGGGVQPFGLHLNPKEILFSGTFDLQIYEKRDPTKGALPFFKITDCRITRRGASLNKRSTLIDSYAFVGVLAGDTDLGTAAFPGPSSMDDTSPVEA